MEYLFWYTYNNQWQILFVSRCWSSDYIEERIINGKYILMLQTTTSYFSNLKSITKQLRNNTNG